MIEGSRRRRVTSTASCCRATCQLSVHRHCVMEGDGDVDASNCHGYADAEYWDARYLREGHACSFDWYQLYSALKPFIRKYMSTDSRVLMVGCGNASISEDMSKDGFEDIVNIDLSSVVIDIMREKHKNKPQLKYMQMDVRDMSDFDDASFDSVIDKGTLDALMCGTDASLSASQMLSEVSRVLKPGGVYMLITYGEPTVRMPHIHQPDYNWTIELYIMPRHGFRRLDGSTVPANAYLEPVSITEEGTLPKGYVLEDSASHYIYICKKTNDRASDFIAKSRNCMNNI